MAHKTADNKQKPITDLSIKEIKEAFSALDEPEYRARQVIKWLFQKRIDSFDGMNNIPKSLRIKLSQKFSIKKLRTIHLLKSESGDAVKFGSADDSGQYVIESVLLYDGKRRTACLSSQLGCSLKCLFCETGRSGLIRNLTQHEIIGQLVSMNDYLILQNDKTVTNIVFMGMGEALSNFKTFLSSVEIIMHEDAFNLGGRRITVSTAGIIPSIKKLMRAGLNIGLAISLNTYSNQKRDIIMPVNRQYPIETLMDIAVEYNKKTGAPLTFEYVVVENENDTEEAVSALCCMLKNVPCKVNLIPMNPGSFTGYRPPPEERINAFAESLFQNGIMATVRKSRGRDISGACGQLAFRHIKSK